MNIAFIRPPHTSGYNLLDVREESIITYAKGFLTSCGCRKIKVYDFHLDRELSFGELRRHHHDVYVISVRETGSNVHYALRIGRAIKNLLNRKVVFYGQTGRLQNLPSFAEVGLVINSEETNLSMAVGVKTPEKLSGRSLPSPYFYDIALNEEQRERLVGSIETSRGCQYRCRFCFINQGENYKKRWRLHPNQLVLDTMNVYYQAGVKQFVFHDSEFLGNKPIDLQTREKLLTEISTEFPDAHIKIFARVDTLLLFNNFSLLYEAGVRQVFLGVESLSEQDLLALRKGIKVPQVIKCVRRLTNVGIAVNLSFMLFNRKTSLDSLAENISNLKLLMAEVTRHRLLGMPNFLFSFEADWEDSPLSQLSTKTYLRWMMLKRSQPGGLGSAFDPELEALVEICRIAHYELVRKVTKLNLARRSLAHDEAVRVEKWFSQLWKFSVGILEHYTDLFVDGQLSIDTLSHTVKDLYELIARYYHILPNDLCNLETLDEWIEGTKNPELIELEDHGWDQKIPA